MSRRNGGVQVQASLSRIRSVSSHMQDRNSKKLWKTHMQPLLTNIVKPVTCSQCLSAIVGDGNMRTRNNTLKRCGKKKGPALVTRIKSGRKLQDVVGYQNGLFAVRFCSFWEKVGRYCSSAGLVCEKSQVLLFSQEKVTGFDLFRKMAPRAQKNKRQDSSLNIRYFAGVFAAMGDRPKVAKAGG